MNKLILSIFVAIILAMAAFGQTSTAPPQAKLKLGDTAPDFTLTDTAGVRVKLSEFRGKSNVVLAFYVFAFTGG